MSAPDRLRAPRRGRGVEPWPWIRAFVVIAVVALFAGRAHATTRTWTTSSAGNWSTTGNWSGSAVPAAGDAVVINANGNCTIDTAVPKLASITINSGYTGTIAPDTQANRSLVLTGAYAQNCTSCTVNAPGGMSVGGAFSVSAGNFNLNAGVLAARTTFTVNGGNFDNGTGVLIVNQVFTFSSGNFYSNAGTVWLRSGAARSHSFGNVDFQNVYFADALGPGTTGLVGFWKFDDSATPSDDSSGNNYHLTWHGAPTPVTTPLAPVIFSDVKSITLSTGGPDYLEYDSGVSGLSATQVEPAGFTWSMSAWVAPTGLGSNSASEIVSAGDDYFFRLQSTGIVNLDMRKSTSGWLTCASTNAISATDGGWHHFAGTNDGSANLYLYVDGVKTTCPYTGYTQSYSGRYIRVGRNGNASTSYDLSGTVDDIRIYNRQLSDNEVWALFGGGGTSAGAITHTAAQGFSADNSVTVDSGTLTLSDNMYANGTLTINSGATLNPAASKTIYARNISNSGTFTPSAAAGTVVYGATSNSTISETSFNNLRIETVVEPNLVGYYKLDEGANTQSYDWSRQGNNATRVGTTWKTSALPSTNFNNTAALTFNGTSDYATFEAYNHNPITVSAWIYRTADGSFPRIVIFPYFRFYLTTVSSGSTGGIGFLQDCSGTDGNWQSSGTTYSYNAWHHIAATYDGTSTSNAPKLYIDGVSVTVSKQTTPSTTCVGMEGTDTNSLGYIGVGYNYTAPAFANYFTGSIDDVRIYNAILTDNQIAALAAGDYSGTATPVTFTLGGNTTVNALLGVDAGNLSTSSYTLTAANTDATQVASVTNGTLTVGSAATSFKGGLTVNPPATLAMNTSGGSVALGSGKTLTIDGTLDKSTSSATPTIKSVSGNYTFTVGSASTATPTLNINGLNVQNTDANGMNIDAQGSTTTFTSFNNIAFSSSSTTSGATQLQLKESTLSLLSVGDTFDMTGMTGSYSNVKFTTPTGHTATPKALFGATCKNTSGTTLACEAFDSDEDSNSDGIPDAVASPPGGAVAQFTYGSYTDMGGTIEGYPTQSFNWSTFAAGKLYVAFNSVSSGVHKLFARNQDGSSAGYSWQIPSGKGQFVGTVRWDVESGTQFVYVLTSLGWVYKLKDSGTAFQSIDDASPPTGVWKYQQGSGATATAPATMDGTNIFWIGLDSSAAAKVFGVSRSAGAAAISLAITNTVTRAPMLATLSGTTYFFTARSDGSVTRTSSTLTGATSSSTGNPITGPLAYYTQGGLIWGTDHGLVQGRDPLNLGTTLWSYTNANASACSALYFDNHSQRVFYGDAVGKMYAINRGNSTALTGFPFQPSNTTTSSDSITVAPVYVGGVIAYGTTTGKVIFVDAMNNTPTAALMQMYNFNSAVSAISYSYITATQGNFMIATADGNLHLIRRDTSDTGTMCDPTTANQ